MSRDPSRKRGESTALNLRYEELGLIRAGEAARILGVEPHIFHLYAKSHGNVFAPVRFEWKGQTMWGYSLDAVSAVRAKMEVDSR
jgi:hypothetical protein